MLDESLRKGSAIMGAAALSVLGWMRSQRTACREECERHASAGTSRRDRTVASLARLHPRWTDAALTRSSRRRAWIV
jgi:hypothetical protein